MPATYGLQQSATYGWNMSATNGLQQAATYGCNIWLQQAATYGPVRPRRTPPPARAPQQRRTAASSVTSMRRPAHARRNVCQCVRERTCACVCACVRVGTCACMRVCVHVCVRVHSLSYLTYQSCHSFSTQCCPSAAPAGRSGWCARAGTGSRPPAHRARSRPGPHRVSPGDVAGLLLCCCGASAVLLNRWCSAAAVLLLLQGCCRHAAAMLCPATQTVKS